MSVKVANIDLKVGSQKDQNMIVLAALLVTLISLPYHVVSHSPINVNLVLLFPKVLFLSERKKTEKDKMNKWLG